MKIYYTKDSDRNRIKEGATISVASSLADATKALGTALVEPGHFGDCWTKSPHGNIDSIDISPFNENEILVERPGMHPGGTFFWVTPYPTIYVGVYIDDDGA